MAVLKKHCDYCIFQLERGEGEGGFMHYQGYCEFPRKVRLSWLKAHVHSSAHWEKTRNRLASIDYCSKSKTRIDGPWEHGERPETQKVKSSRLKECTKAIEDGCTWAHVMDEYPDVYVRHGRIEDLWEYHEFKNMQDPLTHLGEDDWRDWQKQVIELVETEVETPNDRQVIWVYGEEGGEGKTSLCKHLYVKYRPNSVLYTGGKLADMVLQWKGEPVVLFNLPRDAKQYFQFSFVESMKDAFCSSGKYRSKLKSIDRPAVVVVFANWLPLIGKLSEDRYTFVCCTETDESVLAGGSTRLPPNKGAPDGRDGWGSLQGWDDQ